MTGRDTFATSKAEAAKYWPTIRWDATAFLTMHDGRQSRLFYDKISSSLRQDAVLALRGIAGRLAQSAKGFISAVWQPRPSRRRAESAYLLLVAPGNSKYASEEQSVIEACHAKGLAVKAIHMNPTSDTHLDTETLPIGSMMTAWDHVRVLGGWLRGLARGLPGCILGGRKRRSLYVAAIPGMWDYLRNIRLAERIAADVGRPRAVLSLLPSAPISIAIVECMKNHGVLTAAIRTQTTSRNIEHLVINTDVLFCKSPSERRAYEEVFADGGPRLEEGCVLSLPEVSAAEPLRLPERYALLLGTAPSADQSRRDYERFTERLFGVAAAAELPIVFKGHNLTKQLDDAWLADRPMGEGRFTRVDDIGRNRELIERASLVVSAPSTLLYYAILCDKPIVVVESKIVASIPDEFASAPICRIAWNEPEATARLDWESLRRSATAARAWFEENYCMQKGADHLIQRLLSGAEQPQEAFLSAGAAA
ncbi:MAG: hypothetical protein LLG00_07485 [Planctomycetaceae bacterium]|nr:hypothetical protein [Planctomycetaceae bacterium]